LAKAALEPGMENGKGLVERGLLRIARKACLGIADREVPRKKLGNSKPHNSRKPNA